MVVVYKLLISHYNYIFIVYIILGNLLSSNLCLLRFISDLSLKNFVLSRDVIF